MANNLKSRFRDKLRRRNKQTIISDEKETKKVTNVEIKNENNTEKQEKINEKELLIEKENLQQHKEKTDKKDEKEIEKINLRCKILKKIEKNLQQKKDELEIINSEIYAINKITSENKTVEEIKEQQDRIIKLQNKIKSIKEQLKIYIDNDVINKAIMLDEKSIIDDILDYKRMLEEEETLKEDYETIKEYTYIVEEIDKINDRCIELDVKKQQELEKLNISEEQFREMQIKVVEEDGTLDLINNMMEDQNKEIREMNDNINKIESKYEYTYNYDMLNKLISLELKYLALLSLSPFKSLLPSIAISTVATKDMITMLSSQKLIRTEEKIIYYAQDYTKNINDMTYKLDEIEDMLNTSLNSIEDMKEKFSNDFKSQNNSKFEELWLKIEKIEDLLKNNMSKVEIHRDKINKNKSKNNDKLKKVLELNGN